MPIIDARYYKTILISPSKSVVAEVSPLLAYGLPLAPVQEVNSYPNRRQLVDLLRATDAKLCFLDFGQEKAAVDVLADLQAVAPQLMVIALLGANNPDLILRFVRQGVSDFLIKPFTNDQIDACIEKIARTLPAPSGGSGAGKVVAVMPAKGSSGATTIACNLAYQCKRLGATKVLLADMDPLTGTVSFLLKVKNSYSFIDVLQRSGSLEADLWKQMTTLCQGIDVLLSPEALVDPQSELATASPVVEFAQGMYEAVILDCGGVYGNWNMSMARFADEVLLVTTNEMASLQAVQRAFLHLDSQRVDTKKLRVVVNRYNKDAGLQSEYFSEALGAEVFQVIPTDNDAVQRSLMEGKPIAANNQIGKGLASIAERIVSFEEKESKKGGGKGRLLSSFFR